MRSSGRRRRGTAAAADKERWLRTSGNVSEGRKRPASSTVGERSDIFGAEIGGRRVVVGVAQGREWAGFYGGSRGALNAYSVDRVLRVCANVAAFSLQWSRATSACTF